MCLDDARTLQTAHRSPDQTFSSTTWWGAKSLCNRVLVLRGRYGDPWWSSRFGIHQGSGRDDSRTLPPLVVLVCVLCTGPPVRNPVFAQHVTGPDWVGCAGALSARSLVLMSVSILGRCWHSAAPRETMRSTPTSSSTIYRCAPPVCSAACMQHPQWYLMCCYCRSGCRHDT